MSGQALSPKPWRMNGHGWLEPNIVDADGEVISGFDSYDVYILPDSEDCARIVSCVNALAGVPRPEGIPALIAAAKGILGPIKAKAEVGIELTWEERAAKEFLSNALVSCGLEP